MRYLPRAILALLLALGLLGSAAWVASYFWWPQAGFPWPTTGLSQKSDRGFLLLMNGRVFVARQRVEIAPMPPGTVPPPASLELGERPDTPPAPNAFAADSSTLGTLIVQAGPGLNEPEFSGRTLATLSTTPVEPSLAGRPWKRLGFTSAPIASPRIAVNGVLVTGRWTATSAPLWPLVLAAVPTGVLLFRGRRSQRWAAEGRCAGCGYDLRESPDRCPECGRLSGRGTRTPAVPGQAFTEDTADGPVPRPTALSAGGEPGR